MRTGIRELDNPASQELEEGRQRSPGAGRKFLSEHDPGLLEVLERLEIGRAHV